MQRVVLVVVDLLVQQRRTDGQETDRYVIRIQAMQLVVSRRLLALVRGYVISIQAMILVVHGYLLALVFG